MLTLRMARLTVVAEPLMRSKFRGANRLISGIVKRALTVLRVVHPMLLY